MKWKFNSHGVFHVNKSVSVENVQDMMTFKVNVIKSTRVLYNRKTLINCEKSDRYFFKI